MDEQKGYQKILVKLICPKELLKKSVSEENLEIQKAFNKKCKEKEDLFSSLISNEIDNKIGNNNWALVFYEIENDTYDVDIYCPLKKYFSVISIVKNNIKNVDFQFAHKGEKLNKFPTED